MRSALIDKIVDQPITAFALLLLLFGISFGAFYKRTEPVSQALIWATVFTLLAVIWALAVLASFTIKASTPR